jgi:5'-methylthioadenosine phosphorylase
MSVAPRAEVAVIGGSGLYRMPDLKDAAEAKPDTPFGPPSDVITIGTLGGARVAFLPRHGVGHRHLPSEVPSRANIWALKSLGVERIISVNAVGSLKEEVRPLDLVVPNQLIDRTTQRSNTFFGDGLAAHIGFADPFCAELRPLLASAARSTGRAVHESGTLVVMQGPAFSTRAESMMYRSWGADVIGMTALPEAKLAREAEICYVTLACVTDYDCWRDETESVTVEMIVQNLLKNVAAAQASLRALVPSLPATRGCGCGFALKNAIITDGARIDPATRRRIGLLVDKYLG